MPAPFEYKGLFMDIGFYYVDSKYIDYIKKVEIESRGFTTVPNVNYNSRDKFVYGAVLNINNHKYYVPVSSYSKKQQDNVLLKIKSKKQLKVVGSLRFNYMFPVPDECLTKMNYNENGMDKARITLVAKEYLFCKINHSVIVKTARKTYNRVINKVSEELVKNSCDFHLLEKACYNYKDNL